MTIFTAIATAARRRRPVTAADTATVGSAPAATLPPIDPVELAKQHARSDHTGPALDEPGARFLYNRAVTAVRLAYRTDRDLRAAQAELADAEHELHAAQLAVSAAKQTKDGAAESQAEVCAQVLRLAERRRRKAEANHRQLRQAMANIEVTMSDRLAVLGETELARELNIYALTFDAQRRKLGLPELEPLPTGLVQQVVTEAVSPLTAETTDDPSAPGGPEAEHGGTDGEAGR